MKSSKKKLPIIPSVVKNIFFLSLLFTFNYCLYITLVQKEQDFYHTVALYSCFNFNYFYFEFLTYLYRTNYIYGSIYRTLLL